MIPVVTAADSQYFPGVIALHNSFKKNAGPGFRLFAILYDEDDRREARNRGINVIEPPEWDINFPTSKRWLEPSPPMYVRLLLPRLFSDMPRSIWLDADCIVVQPLAPLAELRFQQPVAAVHFDSDRYTLGFNIPNLEGKLASKHCPFTGLLVFNHAEWNRRKLTEQCEQWMADPHGLDFSFVVQSVLGLVLEGDYFHLPYKWQVFAGRSQRIPDDARILHWVGGAGRQPWLCDMPNDQLWRQYA